MSHFLRTFIVRGMAAIGILTSAALAAPPRELTVADLTGQAAVAGLVDNTAFLPGPDAQPARSDFTGSLVLTEVTMGTDPAAFAAAEVMGKNPQIFPGVTLAFFTSGGDLVPVNRDVIRAGSTPDGKSYWDMIVQPGRVWSVPADGEWSRAAFPFALVHSIEGESHNGVATFLYKADAVTDLRFQIVQQTAPYLIEDYFTAWGRTPARLGPSNVAGLDKLKADYAQEAAERFPTADWSALEEKVGVEKLAGFESAMNQDEVLLSGLVVDGTFYHKPCKTAAGPLPYCDRAAFGVWSATKSLANAAALLRLAQKYGPEVFDARITDYVTIPAAHDGWRNVTFGNLLNMASGVGFGSAKREPNDSGDGYLEGNYADWYTAPSEADKIAALAQTPDLPWGPGEVTRYRDQDMFLLGSGMAAYLRRKEGPDADLWNMLVTEVYRPIGIHHAATNRTIEPDGAKGLPVMYAGYYPTLGDMAKIAQLFQNRGRHGDNQILYAPMLDTMLAGPADRGLPSGNVNAFGEGRYHMSFWNARFEAGKGCNVYLPAMEGWGGNIVALMPNGMVGIRLAKNWEWSEAVDDYTGMAAVANRLAPFCK